MPPSPVRVEGLAELQRAFTVASRAMAKDLRSALESAGGPVRQDAEQLARSSIPRIGTPWSRMRVGVTRHSVYVAPVERGDKSRRGSRRRRNFADLLLGRAMEPALERNRERVVQELEDTITDMARAWERV